MLGMMPATGALRCPSPSRDFPWHFVRNLACAVTLVALAGAPSLAQSQAEPSDQVRQSLPGGFTPEQVDGIEQIIRQYLMQNPQVLIDSLTAFQQQQKLVKEQRQQQAVIAHRDELAKDPETPVFGNPEGDVVIVEFFDYRCGYCRRVVRDLRNVVEEDGKVRLVMKEFPILGPASIQASRAALASIKQGKYEDYHYALMTQPGDMSDPHLMEVARKVGMDVEQLKSDMESEEIDALIRRNHALAENLGIGGTPAFVFGDTLVPGAVDAETMRRLIAKARAEAS